MSDLHLSQPNSVAEVRNPVAAGFSTPILSHAHVQAGATWLPDTAAGISLSRFFHIVAKYRSAITGGIALALTATALVTSHLTPLYESTTKVKVEHRSTGGLIGQEASVPTSSYDMDQLINTQVQLILSDPVLRPVAAKYSLLDREEQFRGLTPKDVSRVHAQAITLKRLKVLRIPNTYMIAITFRDPEPQIAAQVANAVADSYLQHAFDSRDRSLDGVSAVITQQLADLRNKMNASGQALSAFERQLNLVDPAQRVSMLSNRLLQLNSDYTAAQTDRLRKEAALATIKSGARADLTGDDDSMLAATELKLDDARQQFAKLSVIYGAGHSEYAKALSQVRELETQVTHARARANEKASADYQEAMSRETMAQTLVAQTKHEVDDLNGKTYQYQQLKSDAEADKKLWDDLTRLTREASINRMFQNAIVQVAESALPAARVAFPSLPVNLAIALVLAGLLGLVGAVVTDAVSTRLSCPEETARKLNIDVLGSLPTSKHPIVLVAERDAYSVGGAISRDRRSKLALSHDATFALRNVINIVHAHNVARSMLITSSEAEEGKTTVAANLAFAYSMLGKKTLLIDANLRAPSLHAIFNVGGTSGLAQVLSGDAQFQDTVVKAAREPLFVLPAGITSKTSANLIGIGIKTLIDAACKDFDIVIVDGPDMLTAPESFALASSVEGVVFVTRAGRSSSKRAGQALANLSRAHINTLGLVMNDVKAGQSLAPYFSVHPRPLAAIQT